MKMTVIGCSGSFAAPSGPASSYLLEHTDGDGRTWRVVLDLGSGAFGPLQGACDPADLDGVVFSHLHPDHFMDITGLEVFRAYHERTDLPCLAVHGPGSLPQRLREVMGRDTDVPDGVDCLPFDFQPVVDGTRFEIGPFAFEAGSVVHPVETYAFRITCQDRVLTYSGDTDSCDRLVELADGADVFLCEAGYIEGRDDRFTGVHLTGRRAGQAATDAHARRVVLTHIAPWTDPQVPLEEARSTYTGPLELAAGGLVVDV